MSRMQYANINDKF